MTDDLNEIASRMRYKDVQILKRMMKIMAWGHFGPDYFIYSLQAIDPMIGASSQKFVDREGDYERALTVWERAMERDGYIP